MEFGIHITAEQPINEIVEIYQRAEKMGIKYGYAADEAPSAPYRDPYAVLAALGYGTQRMRLGTAINVPYTRHPALLAYAMKSYDELFPGRMMLGMGPGGFLSLAPLGIKQWDRPVVTVREAVEICRRLFAGEEVTFEGEVFRLYKTKLYAKPSAPIPIMLAARGPQMLQLAGEVADGFLANMPTETIRWSIDHVRKGAERAGRLLDNFMFTNRLPLSISRNRDAAREAVRSAVIPRIVYAHPSTHELTKVDPKPLQRLLEATKGKYSAPPELVTDEMISLYSHSGTPEEIIELLRTFEKLGIRQYVFGPPFGPDVNKALQLIKDEIIPALKKA